MTRKPATPATAKTKVAPHDFNPDPTVPADYTGQRYCRHCHLAGKPGDPRHPHGALPPTPEPADDDARTLQDRVLGERS